MDEVLDVVAPVDELAVVRHLHAVDHFRGTDLGHVGKAGQDADTVQVSKAALDVVLRVEGRVDDVRRLRFRCKFFNDRGDLVEFLLNHKVQPPFNRIS